MGEQPHHGPSDFYGSAGPATPPGGSAWPPPPLWRPVLPSSHGRSASPAEDDPFPAPGGQATAPPLGRRRRSRKHLVGYPLTALAALAVGLTPGSAAGDQTRETRDLAARVSQPAHTVTVTAVPTTGGAGSKAAAPEHTTTERRLTAGPTTAPAERAAPSPTPEADGVLAPADAASSWFENCTAARAAGVTPLQVGDPGYRSALDKDKDGKACE